METKINNKRIILQQFLTFSLYVHTWAWEDLKFKTNGRYLNIWKLGN